MIIHLNFPKIIGKGLGEPAGVTDDGKNRYKDSEINIPGFRIMYV